MWSCKLVNAPRKLYNVENFISFMNKFGLKDYLDDYKLSINKNDFWFHWLQKKWLWLHSNYRNANFLNFLSFLLIFEEILVEFEQQCISASSLLKRIITIFKNSQYKVKQLVKDWLEISNFKWNSININC